MDSNWGQRRSGPFSADRGLGRFGCVRFNTTGMANTPFTEAKLKSSARSMLFIIAFAVLVAWLIYFFRLALHPTDRSASEFVVILGGGMALICAMAGYASMVGSLTLSRPWRWVIGTTFFASVLASTAALYGREIGVSSSGSEAAKIGTQ